MSRKLFMRVDPRLLERYTKKVIPRRRKRTPETLKSLAILKRSLQALPPRELNMLFAIKVLKVEQDDIKELYNVRQSNISYRLERAQYRIELHRQIADICSETELRRALYDVGLPEVAVRAVLGVIKTSSQSATAEALGVTQGSVRHLYSTALQKLKNASDAIPGKVQAHRLMSLIALNYNQLRAIKPQSRWEWKVGCTNYPKRDEISE